MSRAFTKENDDRASGSVVDRFYQDVLGLSDLARDLIARRQENAMAERATEVEDARHDAQQVLGDQGYREAFEAATQRAGDAANSAIWWAIGDAAVGVASRRRLSSEQFKTLVAPLSVAMPWLREAGTPSR